MTETTSSRALVLVGHGSARNPGTRLPICAAVQEIRRRGSYAQVRCGLWKEEPHVSVTLDKLEDHIEEVTVVPVFIADGYYTRQVIPEQMQLSLPESTLKGRNVRYTRAVGSHPRFADLILQRAQEAGWHSGDSLVVLGHGTPRNPESGTNVYLQAERLRRRFPGEEIKTQYIDQAPFVTEVWERCSGQRIVVVPLFVADGWHVTETIPEDLGLAEGRARRGDRELIFTGAAGTDPGMADVILSIAREAEAQA